MNIREHARWQDRYQMVMRQLADERLARKRAESELEKLNDPVAVHINMIQGTIATPSRDLMEDVWGTQPPQPKNIRPCAADASPATCQWTAPDKSDDPPDGIYHTACGQTVWYEYAANHKALPFCPACAAKVIWPEYAPKHPPFPQDASPAPASWLRRCGG